MEERLYYINNSWLTYEQAHNLGYSLLPQQKVALYTQSNEEVIVKRDVSDSTYYDKYNLRWVADFYDLDLYKYINTVKCYRGEAYDERRGYSHHVNDNAIRYVLYDDFITDLQYLYEHKGITTYKCSNIISDVNDNVVVWYDSRTNKYFDDRDDRHYWTDAIVDVQVTMYDSSTNQPKNIYEDAENETFYIDGLFVSRNEFYSHDNYGIIRDNKYVFRDETFYDAYYDSVSEEYCVPNVTSVWLNEEDILALGFIFIEGVADMWRCITPLHLPWKYRPSSATLSFTNTLHSDLQIILPESIEATIGSEVILPEITGIYEDLGHIKWQPTQWNIGEFNSVIVLNEDTVADLECEKVKATVSFANPYYSYLDIPLPESITVDNGTSITLPTVSGEYEDEDHIIYTPYSWEIGQFGASYTVRNNTTANLICEKMRVTLTFTNESHPELEIPLPAQVVRHYGDATVLPRMRGVYRDNENLPWIPLEWGIGGFDQLYTIVGNVTTDLIWQPLSESMEVALCGSMPTDSGSAAAASDYIVLTANGAMKLDLPVWPETNLTENYEIYSGQIEIWHSSYVPYPVPEYGKNSYSTSDQMICGTIRKWGVNDNEYVDFSMAAGNMLSDPMRYADIPLSDIPEVRGDRLKIWDSAYEIYTVEFPIKSGESSEQMWGGSIRKWGNYANSGTSMSIELIGNMLSDPMRYADIPLADIPEVHGDRLKVYDKDYDPIHVDFPDKPLVEPRNQMIGGTIRLKGNKANRGIDISLVFDGGINPNPPEPEPPTPPGPVIEADDKIYIITDGNTLLGSVDNDSVYITRIDYNSEETVSFYFSPRGSEETNHTDLEPGANIHVYDELGNLVSDFRYNGANAILYSQINGNIVTAPSADTIVLYNGHLVLRVSEQRNAFSVQLRKAVFDKYIPICGVLAATSDNTIYNNSLLCGVVEHSANLIALDGIISSDSDTSFYCNAAVLEGIIYKDT